MGNKKILMPTMLCLGLSVVAAQAADMQIQASDSGTVTVQGDVVNADGDVTITKNYGLNEEKLKAMLEQREDRLIKKLLAASGDEKKRHLLEEQLRIVQAQKTDLKKALEEAIQRSKNADEALGKLRGQMPAARIAAAKKSLEEGNTEKAEQVFDEMVDKDGKSIALAAYQSAQLAAGRLDYGKAMRQYKKAVALEEDNPDYLLAGGQMARMIADYDRAQKWLERLLKIREAERNDAVLGLVLNELGLLYRFQGKFAEAEQMMKRSLAIKEKTLGKNHPDLLLTLNNLVGLYEEHEEYIGIEPLIKRSLDICKQSTEEESICIDTPLHNLGWYYAHQGRYEDAELLLKRALKIREKRYGKNHLAVAFSLYSLALLYAEQTEHYAEAESCYKHALTLEENILGKDHPSVIMTLNNLAGLYYAQEKYSEAEQLYERLLAAKENKLGKDHPDLADIMNSLGVSCYKQEKYEQAATMFERSLDIMKKKFPTGHPNIQMIQENIEYMQRKMAEQ